ncbi:MAG: DUF4097 family beta strand repeat-containing protein [Acidobacteriota bacterium]|nr:DUF4097 family beta strand repeat-containing protein [Acidobacteriota bacterium]
MRSKSIVALLLFAVFAVALTNSGCRIRNRSNQAEPQASEMAKPADPQAEISITATEDKDDLPEKEEIRRKFKLNPESAISVYNIIGSLTVETADTDTAELLIVRSAKTREDLQNYRKVKIEQEGKRLHIGIENDRKSLFSAIGTVPPGRQRIVMKIPRNVDFDTYGVNGPVTLGETLGRIEMRNLNGTFKVSRVAGHFELGNVNGPIEATFAPLTGKSIEISDVNGNIELRFEGEVNAELNAWGINGQLNTDLPGVQARDEEQSRGRLKARIGSGGAQIRINGINGNVNLLKAEKAPASAAKVAGQ